MTVGRTSEATLPGFQGFPLDFLGGVHSAASSFHPRVDVHCLTTVDRPWTGRREVLSNAVSGPVFPPVR